MKSILSPFVKTLAILVLLAGTLNSYAKDAPRFFYQLKVYHYKTAEQYAALNTYLEKAYLPAMHRNGFKQVGVFSTTEKDTADKRVYVFIPFKSWDKVNTVDDLLAKDKTYQTDAKAYTDALYNNAPYTRLEVLLLQAFTGMPQTAVPTLSAPKSQRIYELRSYESPTEAYHVNKVAMFNVGDEISIFNRLGFNAVFYSSVIAGGRMPNLMYLTVYANADEHKKHWDAFRDDAQWKVLSAKPEYKNNVSHIDSIFLQAAEYSDF